MRRICPISRASHRRPKINSLARHLLLLFAPLLLGILLLAALLAGTSARARHSSQPSWGWLHTKGVWVEDSANQHVRIAGVTWYGMETYQYVPAGLDIRPLDAIIKLVKSMGFNTIRIPISDQLVRYNPIVRYGLNANRSLIGLHALKVLDRIVADAGSAGLHIILDNENSAARPWHHLSSLPDPLWYNKAYPQKVWVADWVKLAKRYRNNPTVIGFDLRNEPHTNGPGPWSLKTYLKQGATWGPYKGRVDRKTDWRLGAERGGDAVLHVNPHLLIFVEGVQLYPDSSEKRGVESYWWGGILRGVKEYPVKLNVANQLVYSPHEWGPQKLHAMPNFNSHTTDKSLDAMFNRNWGYILKRHTAPIWIGEFGTCDTPRSCQRSSKHGSQGQWWQAIKSYLRHHPYAGWSFFALNGTNSADSHSNNSVLDKTWTHPASKLLLKDLRAIQAP